MIFRHKPEPPQDDCRLNNDLHRWSKWTQQVHRLFKSAPGFDAEINYRGRLIEQTRKCRECNLMQMDIQS